MRRTRRDDIFEWICRYADEMDGPTPSINEIALQFKLNYKTVYYHVMKLVVEGRLRQIALRNWPCERFWSDKRIRVYE